MPEKVIGGSPLFVIVTVWGLRWHLGWGCHRGVSVVQEGMGMFSAVAAVRGRKNR